MIAKLDSSGGAGAPRIYQLDVTLAYNRPRIWRRLQVPADATLDWLHAVIQVAMGWTNSHLHQFICGERIYADRNFFGDDPEVQDERKIPLRDAAPREKTTLMYEYDLGDTWLHAITVEKILPAPSTPLTTASCMDGARACPPEDCGGPPGYEDLLKALKNRKHPEHESKKEWLGRPFDPESFNPAITSSWLGKLKWPRVTETQLRKILMARDGYTE